MGNDITYLMGGRLRKECPCCGETVFVDITINQITKNPIIKLVKLDV